MGSLQWYLMTTAGVVITLSTVADLVALLLVRGRRWAWWALIGIALIGGLAGIVLAYYILPLLLTIGAVAIIVLLLLPPSRMWGHPSRVRPQTPAD